MSFITLLFKGGASVRVAQELARHSDPKLTLNVYSKLGVHDLTGALDALPSQRGKEREQQKPRATGSGGPVGDPQQHPQQPARE
ncbi:MAG: hypothetical protein B6D36_07220, partial [Planctomycetes bacterium UTPLA1]